MSQPFLKYIAEKIIRERAPETHRLCVVFPNRRASLFLRKHLYELQQKAFVMPAVLSMEDFIQQYTKETVIDLPALIFRLYRLYRNREGVGSDTFEEFLKWGQILLSDFSDIDRHLADPAQLFGYLSDVRAIEQWNPESGKLTPLQEKYLQFWNSFLELYQQLNQDLEKDRFVTEAMAYRRLASNPAPVLQDVRFEHFLFAGFNALTLSEEKIISSLINEGKAELVWDTDSYYAEPEMHEAGRYIRKYKSSFARGHVFHDANGFSEEKHVTVLGVPQQVGQAFMAGKILKDSLPEAQDEKTAVVLADENLLFPVLNALPEKTGQPNITMGFPLSQTLFHDFAFMLFGLHTRKREENRTGKQNQVVFYYKDLARIFTHPYLNGMTGNFHPLRGISEHIASQNRVMLAWDDLISMSSEKERQSLGMISEVFSDKWDSPLSVLGNLEKYAEMFSASFVQGKPESQNESEFLAHYLRLLRRLTGIYSAYPEVTEVSSLRLLIRQLARVSRVPFYGEPLTGIQIMGMLETRNLDFENLILLSVNEGILPSGKSDHSLIPFDIRARFGLPTYREQDAIYAYHFYRLLQRAKRIYLIYNNDAEGYGKAERSRFIIQLLHELRNHSVKASLSEFVYHPFVPLESRPAAEFRKTPYVMNRLREIAEHGFSPSMLSRYIRCKLQFYYAAIARLGESEELEETLEAATLGSVIHGMLESLYTSFVGNVIDPDRLLEKIKEVEPLSRKIFAEKYKDGDISRGKNLLAWKMAVSQTERFLRHEAGSIRESGYPVTLLNLEEPLSCPVSGGAAGTVKIQGKADRIDGIGRVVRILDYKSGRVKKEDLIVKDIAELTRNYEKSKAFQLAMYALMYDRMHPDADFTLQPAIIGLQKISEGPALLSLPEESAIDRAFLDAFSAHLEQLLAEIFHPDTLFVPCEDAEICQNCDYLTLCSRYSESS